MAHKHTLWFLMHGFLGRPVIADFGCLGGPSGRVQTSGALQQIGTFRPAQTPCIEHPRCEGVSPPDPQTKAIGNQSGTVAVAVLDMACGADFGFNRRCKTRPADLEIRRARFLHKIDRNPTQKTPARLPSGTQDKACGWNTVN